MSRDVKPVYMVHMDKEDEARVLVGFIPRKATEELYNRCEDAFDWGCGLIDSGFLNKEIVVYVQDDFDWNWVAWHALCLRDWCNELSGGLQPCYNVWSPKQEPFPYSFTL